MTRLAFTGAVFLALTLTTGCVIAGTSNQKREAKEMLSFDRAAPAEIEPIVIGEVRFEQATDPDAADDQLESGYLRAVEVESGNELWRVRVYTPEFINGLERDAQEVYFSSLKASDDGSSLIVENEEDERFRVDAATGAVTPLQD